MRAFVLMRSTLLPALTAAVVVSGCDNTTEPPPPGDVVPTYPTLSTPQNVLMALAIAYEREDTTETKAVYDSSYVGTSWDLSGGPGPSLNFSYADEVDHVASLARNPLVTVQDFTLSTALNRLPSDDLSHPDWAVIQISGSNFRIQIFEQISGNTYQVTGSDLVFEFKFKPSTPEASSPTDTLWKCVRWSEIRS